MKKKLLFVMAALLFMVLSVVLVSYAEEVSVSAATKKTKGDWEYEYEGKTATITKYNGTASTVKIPSKIGGKTIVAIGRTAFEGNINVEVVKIPKTVKELGWRAFYRCENLTKVVFASKIKLTKFDDDVFAECVSLTTIKLPASLTEMGGGTFAQCKSLVSMTIPAKVTTLGNGTFYNCVSLEKVTIKGKLKELPRDTFFGCGYLENINLPSTIEVIGSSAFGSCTSLETFTVPSNTKVIGYHAFFDCSNLEVLDLGSKVTDIEAEIFYGNSCYNLEKIIMPASVKNISDQILGGLNGDALKYLVIVAPKGSKAENWAQNAGLTVVNE